MATITELYHITVSPNYPKELFIIIYQMVFFSVGLLTTKVMHTEYKGFYLDLDNVA